MRYVTPTPPTPPTGCDPKHLHPKWIPGCWQFCSDSNVVEAHLAKSSAYLLYTSICYTGPLKGVNMLKRLCQYVHKHRQNTDRGNWGLTSLSLWHVTWSREGLKERRERAEVCVCWCKHVSVCVFVCRSDDSLLLYKLAASQPPAGLWVTHVGWVAGVSNSRAL